MLDRQRGEMGIGRQIAELIHELVELVRIDTRAETTRMRFDRVAGLRVL